MPTNSQIYAFMRVLVSCEAIQIARLNFTCRFFYSVFRSIPLSCKSLRFAIIRFFSISRIEHMRLSHPALPLWREVGRAWPRPQHIPAKAALFPCGSVICGSAAAWELPAETVRTHPELRRTDWDGLTQ